MPLKFALSLPAWPGLCGNGRAEHTVTSGFEGAWTSNPTKWDHEYLQNLLNYEWQKKKGPGGHWQWEVSNRNGGPQAGPQAPHSHLRGEKRPVMMLTSDVSLVVDSSYRAIVRDFASHGSKFDHAFAHAWYKLMTRDMGPISRCLGPDVPPAQLFQDPLPLPGRLPLFAPILTDLQSLMDGGLFSAAEATPGELFRLAVNCASTFRFTDYRGGCNGGRIRLLPQSQWASNQETQLTLKKLEPIKRKYADLSWSDLIVYAGSVALEFAAGRAGNKGNFHVSFCPGRVDASQEQTDTGSFDVLDKVSAIQSFPAEIDSAQSIKESAYIMGLTDRELTALVGAARSLGAVHPEARDYLFTSNHDQLSNDFFTTLLGNVWEPIPATTAGAAPHAYRSGSKLKALRTDLFFQSDFPLTAVSESYAGSNGLFLRDVAKAFEKLMNLDRFDGPTRNVCYPVQGNAGDTGRV